MIVTPASVEKRLLDLSKEIDDAQKFLDECEQEFFKAKGDCEIALAQARLEIAHDGLKITVQQKDDLATLECADLIKALYSAEAKVRAARGNASRVKVQIEITRSIGTSVRASLDN
jgi:hypothetical protein